MKRKGVTKRTLAKYMAAFTEIKIEIDLNPKTRNVSAICNRHNIGKQPATQLKKMGIINQTPNGLFWVGENPSIRMVVQICESIHQYHVELRKRKSTDGDLFKPRKHKKIIITTSGQLDWQQINERPLIDDEQPITISSGETSLPGGNFDWPKPTEKPCETVEKLGNKRISELNGDDLQKWHESYKKQIGEPTGIPIKQPRPDASMVSEFVDHHQDSLNGVFNTAKPFESTPEPTLNWFQKLIKLIFRIK